MRKRFLIKFLMLTMIVTSAAFGGSLEVSDFYYRSPRPGAKMTAAYGTFKNKTKKTIKLVTVSSPSAEHVEIHRSLEKGKMASMEPVDSLSLEPGETVELKPRGLHLMIFGFKPVNEQSKKMDFEFSFDGLKKSEKYTAIEKNEIN